MRCGEEGEEEKEREREEKKTARRTENGEGKRKGRAPSWEHSPDWWIAAGGSFSSRSYRSCLALSQTRHLMPETGTSAFLSGPLIG